MIVVGAVPGGLSDDSFDFTYGFCRWLCAFFPYTVARTIDPSIFFSQRVRRLMPGKVRLESVDHLLPKLEAEFC